MPSLAKWMLAGGLALVALAMMLAAGFGMGPALAGATVLLGGFAFLVGRGGADAPPDPETVAANQDYLKELERLYRQVPDAPPKTPEVLARTAPQPLGTRDLETSMPPKVPLVAAQPAVPRPAGPGPTAPTPIAILRRPPGAADHPEGSYFGGVPMLRQEDWPQGPSGPLPHRLTLDLADLPSAALTDLPRQGYLSVFATVIRGEAAGALVYSSADATPAEPATAPATRRWAAALMPLDGPDPTDPDQIRETLNAAFPDEVGTDMLKDRFRAALADSPAPVRWQAARDLARFLRRADAGADAEVAAVARAAASAPPDAAEALQARLAYMRSARAQFAELAQTVRTWSAPQKGWTPMTDEERRTLTAIHSQLAKAVATRKAATDAGTEPPHDIDLFFPRLADRLPRTVEGLATRALWTLLQSTEATPHLPPDLVALRGPRALPAPGVSHRMFGPDTVPADGPVFSDRPYPLIRLEPDPSLGWDWGKAGGIVFRIAPKDLRAGRWDRARATLAGC